MLSASMGHTIPLPNDRHISFVINNENDSIESAHTIVVVNDDDGTAPATVTDNNSISSEDECFSGNRFDFPSS